MQTSLRLVLVVLFAALTGPPILAAAKSQQKKTAKPVAAAKKTTSADKETSAKKTARGEDDEAAETSPVMPPAAVSTISIEDISGFNKYPKQIQSLVQSSMALTRLDLGYLYGSHEPSKGGMDCSGTIYHVLHFQGLKDVPRQSDEMCQWVEKKAQLHLTPTATRFDSDEFAALKPGDLLFWTNTTATTRKLPVTHVMIYLGKLKKSGKRIVFGASDGRSFQGERRSGVSVFDFSLPRDGSTSRFYGYGPVPGLLPAEPEPPALAQTPPAPKEPALATALLTAKQPLAPKETPVPKVSLTATASSAPEEIAVLKEASTAKAPPAPKEEVRKAVAADAGSKSEPEAKKKVVADAASKPKASTTTQHKSSATKKKSHVTASTTRRRTPAAPQKSVFQQRVDQTVSSVRRFFMQ